MCTVYWRRRVTGRFTKSKLNKYNWTKQLNKKSVEQKSIEQKVNWASGYLNKYLIDQIPTGQMHLNKITGTIEQMLNWTNCHSRAIHRLRLAECVVARSAMKPGGFGGLAPHSIWSNSNAWRLSCLSNPQLTQTICARGCNNFLKPLTTFMLNQTTTDPNPPSVQHRNWVQLPREAR